MTFLKFYYLNFNLENLKSNKFKSTSVPNIKKYFKFLKHNAIKIDLH